MQAFSSYEHNVAEQAKDLPPLACHKGCGTCCRIQVAATMPEVLMVARYVRAMAEGFRKIGIDLPARLAAAQATAPAASGTMALGGECPFLAEGICVIYPVRPLACRGHVSFDAAACIAALEGEADEVPVSESHRTVRALVQGRCNRPCAMPASRGRSTISLARCASHSPTPTPKAPSAPARTFSIPPSSPM